MPVPQPPQRIPASQQGPAAPAAAGLPHRGLRTRRGRRPPPRNSARGLPHNAFLHHVSRSRASRRLSPKALQEASRLATWSYIVVPTIMLAGRPDRPAVAIAPPSLRSLEIAWSAKPGSASKSEAAEAAPVAGGPPTTPSPAGATTARRAMSLTRASSWPRSINSSASGCGSGSTAASAEPIAQGQKVVSTTIGTRVRRRASASMPGVRCCRSGALWCQSWASSNTTRNAINTQVAVTSHRNTRSREALGLEVRPRRACSRPRSSTGAVEPCANLDATAA